MQPLADEFIEVFRALMTTRRKQNRPASLLALLLISLLAFDVSAAAPKKKKATTKSRTTAKAAAKKPARKAPARKAAAAAPVAAVASGVTFEQRLSSLMNSAAAARAVSSLQVVEVDTGRVIAERNPHLPVAPASNMKLFTTAAGMDLLGSNFEFKTGVYMRGNVDASGTLQGDVKVVGRGDPALGGRFNDGNGAAIPETWAKALREAGVKTIAGNLIFEYGYFDTEYTHPTWPRDQLVNWYEAPVAALSMQEGCVMVRILPSKPGARAIVQLQPANTFVNLQNTCVTGGGRGIYVTRQLGSNDVIVRGNVPPRAGPSDIFVTIQNPVHYFANVTHQAFERSGVHVAGSVSLVKDDNRPDWKLVTEHRTPLTVVNYVINKKSQNHYAEQLLKTVGAEQLKDGSFKGGAAAVTQWLTTKVGVPANEYQQIDGSGMSKFNRASANAFVHLLRYMWNTDHRNEYLSSMPYSGEHDSRFGKRLRNPPYARQVYAKTGYIVGVIGLSGYVRGQSGKVYAFSFLFNKYPTGVYSVYNLQDQMLKEIVTGG